MVDSAVERVGDIDCVGVWSTVCWAMDSAEQWLEVPQVSGWLVEWLID